MGKDTHALSGPAQRTALEVLAANGVETVIQQNDGVTPTPVISRAILVYNRGRQEHLADGIVITPSHNPPEDGGFKYNPTNGGPADTDVTQWVEDRANELLRAGNAGVKTNPNSPRPKTRCTPIRKILSCLTSRICATSSTWTAIRGAGLKLGVDPLGGASRALLGADQLHLRIGHHRREPGDRPDLLVHDRRSRRQDPHGLLQPVRHGTPGRPQRPISSGLRQRPGRRPARNRDALRRTDESESLSRRGDPVPAHQPSRMAPGMRQSARHWSAAA